MASYLKKEISEWNTTDLCNWLLANKYRGISELCQKYSLSGYDLFYITDDILKNELGLKLFHERNVALKLFTKLTCEHLRLNIINSNGDNVLLTLDNNQETQLGEIADYIGNMFNINPKDILFKDSTKQEVLSPSVKIVKLLILYPKIYKTLNVSNMKDYHQAEEDMMESGEFNENDNNANIKMNKNYKKQEIFTGSMGSDMIGSGGDMDFKDTRNNNKTFNNQNYNMQINNSNNNNYRNNKMRKNEQRNNLMQDNQDYMNYQYKNNEKMNKNNKINMNQQDNNDLYDSGNNNFEGQMNENENNINQMNMNGSDNNIDYNEDYQNNNRGNNNMQKQYKNEEREYMGMNERKRQNYQYKGMNKENRNFNEESNYGLMSSGNDEEMKFKPSYQIKNSEYADNNEGN